MSDEKRRIAAAKLDEEQRQTNEAIGAFIFAFSQLEFTIRVRLARVLGLQENMADIVTGPYDSQCSAWSLGRQCWQGNE